MGTHPESEISQEAADRTVGSFVGLIKAIEELCNFRGQRRVPRRDAWAEQPDEVANSLKIIADQATLLVRGTCEHLLAFTRALERPQLAIAPFVCVRSALESAALAVWLTDHRVSCRERIARSFALRFEGLLQQEKYLEGSDPTRVDVRSRIDSVAETARQMGYQLKRKRNGEITEVAVRWPGSTETIRTTLDMGRDYRLLSCFAHGHSWAVLQLSYRRTSAPDMLERHISPAALLWLCLTGARALSWAVWSTSEFLGEPRASTLNLLNELYDELRINMPRPWNYNAETMASVPP